MDADDWNRRYRGADLVWTADANRFLVAEVGSLPPGRALDLGAGEGRNAVWLAERGWAVTAVDFAQVGLEKGRELAAARGVTVDWVCADVVEHEPEAGVYDLVVVLYVHLPAAQRHQMLGHAGDALAPGGTLLVVGHDRRNLAEGVGGPQDPAILCTPTELVDELAELSIERADTVERHLDDGRVALDTLLRARRV